MDSDSYVLISTWGFKLCVRNDFDRPNLMHSTWGRVGKMLLTRVCEEDQ